jgi:hypothetical protein
MSLEVVPYHLLSIPLQILSFTAQKQGCTNKYEQEEGKYKLSVIRSGCGSAFFARRGFTGGLFLVSRFGIFMPAGGMG